MLATLLLPFAAAAEDGSGLQPGTAIELGPLTVNGASGDGLHLTEPSSAGSRLGLTPLQTPASVEVLSGETIRDRNEITVNQAVSRATGFSAIPTPGNGENGVSVRGFTGVGSVTQLLDGTQLYVGSGTTTFPFDSWSIDRIEILNGAGSLLYGTGAVGGVINVVSREPDMTGFHNEARLSVGSFDTFGEQIHSTGPISPKAAYRLDLSNFTSAGYVHRGNASSLALSGALRVDPTPTLSITLSDDYGFQRPMNYLGTPLVNGRLLPGLRYDNYDAADGRVQYTDNFLQLKATWTPTDSIVAHNDAYLLTDQRLFREVDYYTYQPASGLLQVSDHREVYHHQTQYGDHGDIAYTGDVLGFGNKVIAGFDTNYVKFKLAFDSPYNGSALVALGNDNAPNFTNSVGTTPSYSTGTTQIAGYTEDRFSVLDTLSLVAGLRVENYNIRRDDLHLLSTTKNNLTSIGWNVGTVYEPIPKLSLYARYAVATDPVNNVISLTPAQQAFALATGRQEEAGVKQAFWNDRGAYTFAGYRIVKNNLLVPDPTNPGVSQQIGQQSAEGLEASLAFTLGHGVHVEGNGTILRARFDSFSETVSGKAVSRSGNIPPNVPERGANLFATWNFADSWQLRADAQYVGRRFADNANLLILPAYYVVGAGLRWQPLPSTSLDLLVANALNKTYAVAPYNGGTQYFLGPPLSITGRMTVVF